MNFKISMNTRRPTHVLHFFAEGVNSDTMCHDKSFDVRSRATKEDYGETT